MPGPTFPFDLLLFLGFPSELLVVSLAHDRLEADPPAAVHELADLPLTLILLVAIPVQADLDLAGLSLAGRGHLVRHGKVEVEAEQTH